MNGVAGTSSGKQGARMSLYIMSTQSSDDLDHLLADSALAAIDPEAPLLQIETALRSLVPTMAKADPLRRPRVREAVVRRLRAAGVHSPATLADTAFGGAKPPDLDSTIQLLAATPWAETIHGPELLDDIVDTLRRFVVLPAGAAEAQAVCV